MSVATTGGNLLTSYHVSVLPVNSTSDTTGQPKDVGKKPYAKCVEITLIYGKDLSGKGRVTYVRIHYNVCGMVLTIS